MKHLYLGILAFIFAITLNAQQAGKIAVYVTNDDVATANVVGSKLVISLIEKTGFEVNDRTADFTARLKAQSIATADNTKLSQLGKQFGVDFVCVANVSEVYGQTYTSARILDVETATVVATAEGDSKKENLSSLVQALDAVASKLYDTGSWTKVLDKVKDIDGNEYDYIKIGNQVWLAENLKTTKYNDGTAIPNITGAEAWKSQTTGAYCWYNNTKANGDTYGVLYNFYAVETNKLCPSGWHVPSDSEWTTLETYLINNGYNYDGSKTGNKIAKSLASATGWYGNTDYYDYRNKTGFTAVPGGYRSTNGDCNGMGNIGYWWSSSVSSATNSWYRSMFLDYDNAGLSRGSFNKVFGFSVRCVRD